MSARVSLRPDVVVEPTIRNWYAIPHLIAPVQSALVFEKKLLPILRSFVQMPQAHVRARNTPSLAGSSFVSLDLEQVRAAKALVEQIEGDAGIKELTRAIAETEQLLKEATGDSLEPFYERLPAALRGFV